LTYFCATGQHQGLRSTKSA